MKGSHGYGCFEHPYWSSLMVPDWMGWWLPDLHLWLHRRRAKHDDEDTVE